MRTRSFSGNGFISPIPPGESKSLITFPPTEVAPLGLWVIPPTKEHAASHQRRCLSIGLHHPHPAPSSPSSPSGSIIPIWFHPIWLHHPHHPHPAPSSPSGSIPSGSIISIRLHHSIQLHISITSIWLHHPPSGYIIPIRLHHLHPAPSPPSGSIRPNSYSHSRGRA